MITTRNSKDILCWSLSQDEDERIQTRDPGYSTANYFTRVSPKNSSMTSSFCHWSEMKDERWSFKLLRDYEGPCEYLETNVTVSNRWDVTSMGWYPVFKTGQFVLSNKEKIFTRGFLQLFFNISYGKIYIWLYYEKDQSRCLAASEIW